MPRTNERGKRLREAVENLFEDVDEVMAEGLRLHDLQQKLGAVFLGYGGGYNHEDDLLEALAADKGARVTEHPTHESGEAPFVFTAGFLLGLLLASFIWAVLV